MARRASNVLPVVFLTVFIDLFGYGVLIPVVPELLANPSSPFYLLPSGSSMERGYLTLGLLLAAYSIAQFFSTPILGQLSDRFGRKKILTIALVCTTLSYLAFGVGIIIKSIPLLFLTRVLDGLGGGSISVSQAAVADVTPREGRARAFGILGAAFGLGFILGPFIGGKLADPTLAPWFGPAVPFWFAAALSGLNLLSVLWQFPETLKAPAKGLAIHWHKAITNVRKAFEAPGLRPLYLMLFLYNAGISFFVNFFSVFLIAKFNFSEGHIGDFFAYIGILVVIGQVVIVRYMNRRFREWHVLRFSLLMTAVGILLYLLPSTWWGLVIVGPIFAFANGLTIANGTGLVSSSAGARVQGEVLGIASSVQALAMAIPPVVSGIVAATLSPSAPIAIATALLVAAAAVFHFAYQPPHDPKAEHGGFFGR